MPVLRIDKFLGLTDNKVAFEKGELSKCENFLIGSDGFLKVRNGFTGVTDIGFKTVIKMFEAFERIFFVTSDGKMYYQNSEGSYIEVSGPRGYNAFGTDGIVSNITISRMNDIYVICMNGTDKKPFVLYTMSGGGFAIVCSGLTYAAITSLTMTTGGSTGPYLLSLVVSFTFSTNGGITYTMTSEPITTQVTGTNLTGQISNISMAHTNDNSANPFHFPANGDTSFKYDIYRSESAGQVQRKFHSVTYNSYSQSTSTVAASTSGQPILYTDAGEVADGSLLDYNRTPVPRNVCITSTSDNVFWASSEKTGILRQSKAGSPWSWPQGFDLILNDTPYAICGISKSVLVFFKNSIVRVDGFQDNTGIGSTSTSIVSAAHGCSSPQRVIRVGNIVYFIDEGTLYSTDGSSVREATRSFTLPSFTGGSIYYDKVNNAIVYFNGNSYTHIYKIEEGGSATVSKITSKFALDAGCTYDGKLYCAARSVQTVSPWATSNTVIGRMDLDSSPVSYSNETLSADYLFSPISSTNCIEFDYIAETSAIDFSGNNTNTWCANLSFNTAGNFRASTPRTVKFQPYIKNDRMRDGLMPKVSFTPFTYTSEVSGDVEISRDATYYKTFKRNVPSKYLRSTLRKIGIYRSGDATVSSAAYTATSVNTGTNTYKIVIAGLTKALFDTAFGGDISSVINMFRYYVHLVKDDVNYKIRIESIVFVGSDMEIRDINAANFSAGAISSWQIVRPDKKDTWFLRNIEMDFKPIGEGYKDVKEDG